MTNLLPQAAQKRMKAEFRARFLLAGGLMVFCCALLAICSLLPSEIAIASSPIAEAQSPSQHGTDAAADSATLSQASAILTAITPVAATSSLDAIAAALLDRASGISITGISYSFSTHSLTLQGQSQSPEDVNHFRQTLESDPYFSSVSVPVSALLGSQNGGFTMTATVKQ